MPRRWNETPTIANDKNELRKHALADAGWEVAWVKDRDRTAIGRLDADGRWMGALATSAVLPVSANDEDFAIEVAKLAWSRALPLQDIDAEGCDCCGSPHAFYSWDLKTE